MNLNITELPTKVTPGKHYTCFVDVCREGVQFCNVKTQRCEQCSDYFKYCFSEYHQNNCSQFCLDQFLQNNEHKCNEDIYMSLSVAIGIIYIVTVICMIIRYFRVHTSRDAMRYLGINKCRRNAEYTSRDSSAIRDEAVSLNEAEPAYDDLESDEELESVNTHQAEDVSSGNPDLHRSQCNVRCEEPTLQNQHFLGESTTRKKFVENPILPPSSNQTATRKPPYAQAVSSVSSECRINAAARHDKTDQVTTQQPAAHTKITENSKYENDYYSSEMNRCSTGQSKQSNDNTSVKRIDKRRSQDSSDISENTEEERKNISRQQNERPVRFDNTTYQEQAHTLPSCHDTDPNKDECDDKNELEYVEPIVKQATENCDNTRPIQHHRGRVPGRELSSGSCNDIGRTHSQNSSQIDGNTRRKELDVASRDHHQYRHPEQELPSCNSNGFEGLPYRNSGQSDNTTGYHTQVSHDQ